MKVVLFVAGLLLGMMLSAALAHNPDAPVITFTPYADVQTHADQNSASAPIRTLPAGVPVTLYTPYVGGDARWWAATSEARTEWVAVAVNGYCPRERLGDVSPVMP